MPPQTRVRSRSSVEHIFDLVEGLDEEQLHDLLHELNSSTDTNVPVSKGVEYFEEQRRARAAQASKVLRPTPSFLNSPHEPVDWPRQKPRPVSGSQWRQSMRVVSTPYGSLGRHQTEPISPPLTASPPSSPPLSPPTSSSHESPLSPRRTVTTPILPMEKSARHEIEPAPLQTPVSPPRLDVDEEGESRPSLTEFGGFGFGFGFDGTADGPETPQQQKQQQRQPAKKEEEEARPVSPFSSSQQQPRPADFSRISTMPLPSFASPAAAAEPPRPRTSTGDAATTANSFKPRAFRRISRPQFLSPVNIPTPDALAERLSEYLFDGPSSPPQQPRPSFAAPPRPSPRDTQQLSMEQMLKEPQAPPSRLVMGKVEKEVPSVGIFEVLTEG
ncbi:hypothetical protein diail_1810 [Diaporthe ilicicola]|nr:hypothetical protein diail_1810 [Diaporthe ilicicola]